MALTEDEGAQTCMIIVFFYCSNEGIVISVTEYGIAVWSAGKPIAMVMSSKAYVLVVFLPGLYRAVDEVQTNKD